MSSKYYFSSYSLNKTIYAVSSHHTGHMPRPSHFPSFGHQSSNIWWAVQIVTLRNMQFSPLACYLVPLRLKVFLNTPFSNTMLRFLVFMWETNFHTHVKQETKFYFCNFNLCISRLRTRRLKILDRMVSGIYS